MLANYYGERALAALRALGEVRLNTTGMVLDARAVAQAARGCSEDYLSRSDLLRRVPTRTRFLSFEPPLGPIADPDLSDIH